MCSFPNGVNHYNFLIKSTTEKIAKIMFWLEAKKEKKMLTHDKCRTLLIIEEEELFFLLCRKENFFFHLFNCRFMKNEHFFSVPVTDCIKRLPHTVLSK